MEEQPNQTTAAADPTPAPDQQDFGSNFGDLLDKAFSGHDADGNEIKEQAPETTPAPEEKKPEEPKAEEKKPEAPAAEDDDAPKNMSPKAAEKWATLKAKSKAAEERAAELERRIAEAESKGQTNTKAEAELASLREKVAQFEAKFKEQENELAVTRVEATEEYKQIVVAPTQQLVSQIEAIAKKYEVPVENLLRAVVAGVDSPALESEASSFSSRDQNRLFNIQEQYLDIQKRRESIRQNAEEAMRIVEQRRQQQQEAAAAEENKMWEQALNQGWEELKKSTPLFAEMEKIPERKAQADEIRKFVTDGHIINMAPAEKARLLYQGAAAPYLESIAREFYNENKQLREKLNALQAVSPSPSSGSSEIPEESESDNLDFEALIERKLRA